MAMKKINASNKSRVVCVATPGHLDFYFQLERVCDRQWLLQMPFSGSVWAYFRDHGSNIADRGYSLTIAQVYKFRSHQNPKLSRLFSRLPAAINYVVNESEQFLEAPVMKSLFDTSFEKLLKQTNYVNYEDRVA